MHAFNASKAPVYFQHYSEVIPNSADLDSQAIISIAEKLGNAKTIDSPHTNETPKKSKPWREVFRTIAHDRQMGQDHSFCLECRLRVTLFACHESLANNAPNQVRNVNQMVYGMAMFS